jgi:hypothetical protein
MHDCLFPNSYLLSIHDSLSLLCSAVEVTFVIIILSHFICVCRIPLKTYLLLALLTLGTMGFSNSSLGHLNYPTQVIFKCCKLIPVLVGGILIQQKHYGKLDFLAAGCMCLGLTLFTLTDSHVSPNFSTIGLSSSLPLFPVCCNQLTVWDLVSLGVLKN